ncbi:ABC transporter permease, partial [Streptomyces sp. NPDC079189]
LPPTAKLAERRAAAGRGLTASLAGWQLSRRPLRGAGPVLLLVLAVAMGMLAIGQGASWDRSQDDQADFRAGAPVRVLGSGTVQFGQSGVYDGMPGVRAAVPAARTGLGLSGGRQATVLALDTGLAGTELRLRDDLADADPERLLAALHPQKTARTGVLLPDDTARLVFDVTLRAAEDGPYNKAGTIITLTVEDRNGVPFRVQLDTLAPDGKPHAVTVDLAKAADAPVGRPAGPLALTGVEFDEAGYPDRIASKRLTIGAMRSITSDGATRGVTVPKGLVWEAEATVSPDPEKNDLPPAITAVGSSARTPLDLSYHTGRAVFNSDWGVWGAERTVTVRVAARRAEPAVPAALATDRFLESSGAKPGSVIEIPMPGGPVKVKIAGVL